MAPKFTFARVHVIVEDANAAAETFKKLFGFEYTTQDSTTKQVRVAKSDGGINFIQDISPDGKSSPVRDRWQGGLGGIGLDVADEDLEAAREHLEAHGLKPKSYVEMDTGFRDYSFSTPEGIPFVVYAYPGASWLEASMFEGPDPKVDRFL